MVDNQFICNKSALAIMVAFLSSQSALAQTTPNNSPQEITVTGSNLQRAAGEGSSPILIITAQEIAATGANTISELLNFIPVFGTGASVDITDGGFSKGAATAALHGLSSSSTLILLNGRRITSSAYVDPNQGKQTLNDLNSIALSFIERIEILNSGASAVYGSDAVAGVVNFITKTNYQGKELTANVSGNDDAQFKRKSASGSFGFGDIRTQGFNAFLSFDVAQRDSTKIKDAHDVEESLLTNINGRLNPFSSNLSDQPFFYRERTPGAMNFSNSFARRADVINLTNCDPSKLLTGDRTLHNLSATDVLIGRTFCNFNNNDFAEAQSEGKDANLLGRVTFGLAPSITAFSEFGYARSERRYLGAPVSMRSTISTNVFSLTGEPTPFQIVLPIGHPDNPFPTSRSATGFRLVNSVGGSGNINESYRMLLGAKGKAGAWDWETAALWNRSDREETYFGRLYKPTLERIYTENRTIAATIADPNATRDVINKGYAQIMQLDAKASTEFGKLDGGAIGAVFGAELRQDKIVLTPDAELQNGNIIGLSNSTADGKRNISSMFAELHTPWTKSFETDFSGRYDKYPYIGTSFTPKVGAKWTASDRVALRATYGKDFIAPSLTQISSGGAQSFATITDSLRCPDGINPVPGANSSDCAKSIYSQTSATPDVKPEKSKRFGMGIIWTATKEMDLILDYYSIRKEDEFALLDAQTIIDNPNLYPGRIIRDTNPVNLLKDANGNAIPGSGPIHKVNAAWANKGSTEVKGLDLSVRLRNSLGAMGKLDTKLTVGYLISYKHAEAIGDAEANVAGSSGGISDWATLTGDQPKLRLNLASTWAIGAHKLTGIINFIDSVSLLRRSDNHITYPAPYCHYGAGQPATATQLGGLPKYSDYIDDCKVRSWTTFGVNYNYTGFKNTKLNFSIQNLFDTAAPYDPRYPITGFNTNMHNGYGRYFKLTAQYAFN